MGALFEGVFCGVLEKQSVTLLVTCGRTASLRCGEIELLVPNWLRHCRKWFEEFCVQRWNVTKRESEMCVNLEAEFSFSSI